MRDVVALFATALFFLRPAFQHSLQPTENTVPVMNTLKDIIILIADLRARTANTSNISLRILSSTGKILAKIKRLSLGIAIGSITTKAPTTGHGRACTDGVSPASGCTLQDIGVVPRPSSPGRSIRTTKVSPTAIATQHLPRSIGHTAGGRGFELSATIGFVLLRVAIKARVGAHVGVGGSGTKAGRPCEPDRCAIA